MTECSLCHGDFDTETEGGIEGVIGTFIVCNLCPTCYAGVFDMVQQRCLRCIEAEENDID